MTINSIPKKKLIFSLCGIPTASVRVLGLLLDFFFEFAMSIINLFLYVYFYMSISLACYSRCFMKKAMQVMFCKIRENMGKWRKNSLFFAKFANCNEEKDI